MAAITTTGLSGEMQTYYESKFLERAKHSLVHRQGAQKNTHGKNSGKTVLFNLYAPLSAATTPLTEGTNPAEVNISASTVTATLAEYGNVLKISKLLYLTSIDRDAKEKSELMGQNMGETLDQLTRDELFTGATVQLAGAKAALTDVAATNTLSSAEIRKALRTLRVNKAMPYADGYFMGKIGPYSEYDLMGDTTWVNAHTYKDGEGLYEGEVGKLFGVRFLRTTNQKSEASTVTVYSNFIHGQNAFGVYNLEGNMPRLYVKTPDANDTSNPTDRYSTIGWAGADVTKTLIATWLINIKTGATS